jgi:hypothetical protein|tara:strand:+ start:642 stop:782 length:141 start_codon:yes stop_codon:yes gene_type:complete
MPLVVLVVVALVVTPRPMVKMVQLIQAAAVAAQVTPWTVVPAARVL